jgi:8-oxo-dGTP pyrophosphatase MutT (NUDIX family)
VSPASPAERAQLAGLPRQVVGVAGVVVDDAGHALAVQRRTPPRWELPGGALEVGETLADGLVREVEEETGLLVEPLRLTGVYQNMALGPVALVFLCRRVSGTVRLSEETQAWRWLDRAEIAALMPPAWSSRFTDALTVWEDLTSGSTSGAASGSTSQLGSGWTAEVPVRAHDGVDLL